MTEELINLVEQAKNGSERAFNKLYNKYYNTIWFTVYNIVKNIDVEDAYTYISNGLPGVTRLNEVDSLILQNELKNYNVHLGTSHKI